MAATVALLYELTNGFPCFMMYRSSTPLLVEMAMSHVRHWRLARRSAHYNTLLTRALQTRWGSGACRLLPA
jgi:hypothetical protein